MKKTVNIFLLFLLLVSSLIGANSGSWYVLDVPETSTSLTQQADGKLRLQTSISNGNATHNLPALTTGSYQLQFTANLVSAIQPKVAVQTTAGLVLTEQVVTEGTNTINFIISGDAAYVKIYESASVLVNPTIIDVDNYALSAIQTEESARLSEKVSERVLATKDYELSNHLGNVLAVVSDKKLGVATTSNTTIDYYKADVQSANDYYAYGSLMNGRKYTGDGYRYGFNGQEKDNDISGDGNLTTASFWEYDSRIGRRWNLDPVLKIDESPYLCFSGNPIYYSDPQGDDPVTGLIEALNGFLLNVGQQVASNVMLKGNSFSEALDNVDYTDALVDAGFTYAASFFVTGAGTAAKLTKLAKTDVGQVVIETSKNAIKQVIKDYNEGKFNDKNGDFNANKLFNAEYMESLLVESMGDAIKDHVQGKMVDKVGKKPGIKSGDNNTDDIPSPNTKETVPKNIHANSKKSMKVNHGYVIKDKDGNILKYGISSGKLNKNGSSVRANSQLKYMPAGSKAYVIKKNISGRQKALDWELGKVVSYRLKSQGAAKPPRQKRP